MAPLFNWNWLTKTISVFFTSWIIIIYYYIKRFYILINLHYIIILYYKYNIIHDNLNSFNYYNVIMLTVIWWYLNENIIHTYMCITYRYLLTFDKTVITPRTTTSNTTIFLITLISNGRLINIVNVYIYIYIYISTYQGWSTGMPYGIDDLLWVRAKKKKCLSLKHNYHWLDLAATRVTKIIKFMFDIVLNRLHLCEYEPSMKTCVIIFVDRSWSVVVVPCLRANNYTCTYTSVRTDKIFGHRNLFIYSRIKNNLSLFFLFLFFK
jgi:hypothetical protein